MADGWVDMVIGHHQYHVRERPTTQVAEVNSRKINRMPEG